MKYVGVFNIHGHIYEFYTNDYKVFFHDEEGQRVVDIKQLQDWALIINSPWSQMNQQYNIRINCKDAYTAVPEDTLFWKCTYSVVGCDGILATVIGYGQNTKEAIDDCDKLFDFLQKKYNPENDSF